MTTIERIESIFDKHYDKNQFERLEDDFNFRRYAAERAKQINDEMTVILEKEGYSHFFVPKNEEFIDETIWEDEEDEILMIGKSDHTGECFYFRMLDINDSRIDSELLGTKEDEDFFKSLGGLRSGDSINWPPYKNY